MVAPWGATPRQTPSCWSAWPCACAVAPLCALSELVPVQNRAWPCPLLLWLQASWPLLETSDTTQHGRKPETVTAVFGTGSQGGNYWEEERPDCLPHQYSSEWMCSSIRCLFLHCSVVCPCCKQQQHNLERCNTACLLQEWLIVYNIWMHYNVQKKKRHIVNFMHCSLLIIHNIP